MSPTGTKRKHSEDNVSPTEVKKSRTATVVASQTAIAPKATKINALAVGADKDKGRKTGRGKPASPAEFQVRTTIVNLGSHPDRTRAEPFE